MLVLRQNEKNDEVHICMHMYIQNSERERIANKIDHKPCGATGSYAGNVYIFSQTCERHTEA
jgi:hypothetical protein